MVAEISGAFLLFGLLCPVSMGVMMWFMAKGMRGHKSTQDSGSETDTLAELKSEQARLGEKVETLERDEITARAVDGAAVEDAKQDGKARAEASSVGTG